MASISTTTGDFTKAVLSAEPYKPGQGSLLRNGTLGAAIFAVMAGMYAWSQTHIQSHEAVKWGVPVAVGGIIAWIAFRLVHYPKFADFLIGTEAEINKVSWPSKSEVKVSTVVVLITVVVMAVFLFVTDLFWRFVLGLLGVLKIGTLMGSGSANMFHVPSGPELIDWFARLVL